MTELKSLEQARSEARARTAVHWFEGTQPSGIACPLCSSELHFHRTNMVLFARATECEARCKGCNYHGSVPIPDDIMAE